jgi:hypothetical protein
LFYITLYDKGVEYIKLLSRAERVVGGRALLGRRLGAGAETGLSAGASVNYSGASGPILNLDLRDGLCFLTSNQVLFSLCDLV